MPVWKITNDINKKLLAEIEAKDEYSALDELAKQHGFTSMAQAIGSNKCPADWTDFIVEHT